MNREDVGDLGFHPAPRCEQHNSALHPTEPRYDCVPEALLPEYIRRLVTRYVETGGTLIMGAYGSYSKQEAARDRAEQSTAADAQKPTLVPRVGGRNRQPYSMEKEAV